jgi:hypothetical protein
VVLAEAQHRFQEEILPRLQVLTFGSFLRAPLNNASLIARRIYYKRLDLFEQVYHATGGELLIAINAIMDAARSGGDPYEAVERLLPPGEGGGRHPSSVLRYPLSVVRSPPPLVRPAAWPASRAIPEGYPRPAPAQAGATEGGRSTDNG